MDLLLTPGEHFLRRDVAGGIAALAQHRVEDPVHERGAVFRRELAGQFDRRVVALPGVQIDVGPQTGDVRHQVPNCDPLFSFLRESRQVAGDGRVESCGNFHGAPVAFVCDFCCIATSELTAISERRIEKLERAP